MPEKNTLAVQAIKHGTVIDHITAGLALKIIRFLNLAAHEKLVTVGLNLPSRLMKKKDLIKVAGLEISPEQANEVALLSPNATVNIIRDYAVAKKYSLKLPEVITHLLVCPNPTCITNHERMDTRFGCEKVGKGVTVRCHYCERIFTLAEITSYNL